MRPEYIGLIAESVALLGLVGYQVGNRYFKRGLALRRYARRVAAVEIDSVDSPAQIQYPRSKLDWPSLDQPALPTFYIANLSISELRCFRRQEVSFRFPARNDTSPLSNVNLLLGNNGSGKSTVLRAIAMAAIGPALESSGFSPDNLVRRGSNRARVEGTFVFRGTKTGQVIQDLVEVRRRTDLELVKAHPKGPYWDELYDASSPSFLVVGYGTNRRTSDDVRSDPSQERGRRSRRYYRLASLFDQTATLTPLSAWLPRASSARIDEVRELLELLLPETVTFTGDFEGAEAIFTRRGVAVPLRALSDGFKSYISWVADLLFQLEAVTPSGMNLRDIGGIALVDEVDLLLHPAWQRLVVPTISKALPRIQFVFTSHSPIVAGTVTNNNILLAEDDEDGVASVHRIDAAIHGLSSDQILLSSFFGLTSTRAPDAEARLDRLAHLAVTGDQAAVARYLEALGISEIPDPGEQQ